MYESIVHLYLSSLISYITFFLHYIFISDVFFIFFCFYFAFALLLFHHCFYFSCKLFSVFHLTSHCVAKGCFACKRVAVTSNTETSTHIASCLFFIHARRPAHHTHTHTSTAAPSISRRRIIDLTCLRESDIGWI